MILQKLDKIIRDNVPSGQDCRKEVSELVPDELSENVKRILTDYFHEKSSRDLRKIGSLGGAGRQGEDRRDARRGP